MKISCEAIRNTRNTPGICRVALRCSVQPSPETESVPSRTTRTAKIVLNRPSSPLRVNVQAIGLDTQTWSMKFSQGLRLFFR